MTRPDWCPQDVWEAAEVAMGDKWDTRWFQTQTAHTIARAILAERERAAKVAATFVHNRLYKPRFPVLSYHSQDIRDAIMAGDVPRG